MNIMILLRGACVRESVFNNTSARVTNTGGCILLFRDRMSRDWTYTAPLRLSAPQAQSHSDSSAVCVCAHVLGNGRKAEIMAWLAQTHFLLVRVQCPVVTASPSGWTWLFLTVHHRRRGLAFLVIVHWQSRVWKCLSMHRSVRPVTGLSLGAEHHGRTRKASTEFAAYSWRKPTIEWPLN